MQTTAQLDSQAVLHFNTFERVVGTKALTVPEILSTILDYATRPTLASAACVSRAWSSIALDKLWSNHDVKVLGLLQILPLTARDIMYNRGREWILQRSPTDDEWARFNSYASRVRSLSVSVFGGFEPRITEWKVENEVLFPRLRRVEWYTPPNRHLKISQLRSFVTSGLRELYLRWDETLPPEEEEQTIPFLNDLARIEGLRLEKLKLQYQVGYLSSKLPVVLANLVAANKDSISTLELPHSNLETSVLANHSPQNLKALAIHIERFQVERVPDQIQTLVEVCPHVVYLGSGWRKATSGWRLLSFELRGLVRVGKEGIGEMTKAWPGLKKLGFSPGREEGRCSFPLSFLADIVAGFLELKDLEASFYQIELARDDLLNNLPSPARYSCPSSLRTFRIGMSSPPEFQTHRDSMAEFLARILPPGLRIESRCHPAHLEERIMLSGRKWVVAPEENFGPKWRAILRRIEELHGGVRLRVGSIPEENDAVWF
ncbi:hypothetical protein M407DRAFT_230395 [Tulasnella calospora MUT 4182]|uniref:F-box domain-containing protein n=1 Tax=Tulasnella calospora MUT 4182 TaxID=1051891 RepID=A0A0C3QCK4_9AGAM|nr:hypothetical protein M407DRAFT_230395 [Tulasnella calospora MUT 4182]